MMKKQARSFNIIGGADGPTAVYLTGKSALLWWILPIILLLTSAVTLIHFCKKGR